MDFNLVHFVSMFQNTPIVNEPISHEGSTLVLLTCWSGLFDTQPTHACEAVLIDGILIPYLPVHGFGLVAQDLELTHLN